MSDDINLVEYNKDIHGKLRNGPLDDEEFIETEIPCPECGEELEIIPIQSGLCHSGRHRTRVLREHYVCENENCFAVFIGGDTVSGGAK